jgi:hypothetical protein
MMRSGGRRRRHSMKRQMLTDNDFSRKQDDSLVNPVPRTSSVAFGLALPGVQNIHPVPTVMDMEAPFSHDGVGTGTVMDMEAPFSHDGVGTGFIPALTYGAFCGTG